MDRKLTKQDQNAIKVIEGFIFEINGLNDESSASIWRAKVLSSLRLYIEEENELFIKVNKFQFMYRKYTTVPSNGYTREYETSTYIFNGNNEKGKIKTILENIIEHIKNHGVKMDEKKNSKSNFLSNISTLELLSSVCAAGIVIFGIGYYFGTEKTNSDAIENKIRIDKIRDSLRSFPALNVPEKKPETNPTNKDSAEGKKMHIKHDSTSSH